MMPCLTAARQTEEPLPCLSLSVVQGAEAGTSAG